MKDVFNLSKQIEDLKTEIKSLKAESKYIKKKAEITPLIALFNHVRYQNEEGKSIVHTITFYTKDKERYSYGFDKIIALNDSIHEHTDDGLIKICDIDEITNVELVSVYKGIHRLFEYKFDK
ncbi:hypothetical protein ACFL4H_02025 [Candidatus Neomarinimicrobiota bacterium]